MTFLKAILPYLQVLLSILVIGSVLLQRSDAGLGGALGGTGQAGFYTKRGAEKYLFVTTIVIAILFVIASLLALFV